MCRRYAVMEYILSDGNIQETHRMLVPLDETLRELVEYIEGSPGALDNKFTILAAGEWDETD